MTYLIFIPAEGTNVSLYPRQRSQHILVSEVQRSPCSGFLSLWVAEGVNAVVEVYVDYWTALVCALSMGNMLLIYKRG